MNPFPHIPPQLPQGMQNPFIFGFQAPQSPFNGFSPFSMPGTAQLLTQLMNAPPVGSSSDDETLLVQALRASKHNGQSYRQAMDALHGVNGHTSMQWKDYYLDHRIRVNKLVSATSESLPSRSTNGASAHSRPVPPSSSTNSSNAKGSHRAMHSQLNPSASAFKAPHISKDKARPEQSSNPLDDLPPVPLHRPTPPSNASPSHRGMAIKDEDRAFFLKLLLYELNANPKLTRLEFCDKIAAQAPHRSKSGWDNYWKRCGSVRLLYDNATSGRLRVSPNRWWSDEEYTRFAVAADQEARKTDLASSTIDPDPDTEYSESYDEAADQDEWGANKARARPRHRLDAKIAADKRQIAEYIASVPNWESRVERDRWVEFCNMYTRRPYYGWVSFYQRHQDEINRLVDEMRT